MKKIFEGTKWKKVLYLQLVVKVLFLSVLTACTQQLPGSFRFKQVQEEFSASQDVNTKIDILWVIDNSSSMDVSQKKLREGFGTFATRYMKPTWDIQMATISTDAYLANPVFESYLNRVVPGSVGYSTAYLNSRLETWVNPSWAPDLLNLTTGLFTSGFRYGDLNPQWGSGYATLADGIHDGPLMSMCFEVMPYFYRGVTDCSVRDLRPINESTADTCLNPESGQTTESECVNTIQNNTVRSGKTIINTKPPAGTDGDADWVNALIRNFKINASKGSSGNGSERGLSSLLQFIQDNEQSSDTKLFREDSLRVVIFVSDEEDQSMVLPALDAIPENFGPTTYYSTSCDSKTVDDLTYTVSTCADSEKLIAVSSVKDQLDVFFSGIDTDNESNYIVSAIVPLSGDGIELLQANRDQADMDALQASSWAVDRGDRYIELANLVDPIDAPILDITNEDYSLVLEAIGSKIIEKKSVFKLKRAPTGEEDLIVKIIHANNTETLVSYDEFVIEGMVLRFTDEDFVLGLLDTDKVFIDYQPKSQK